MYSNNGSVAVVKN